MSRACGIDFGTSNSTVGWQAPNQGRPALLSLEGEHRTLPSVVFFNSEDNSTSFGRAALDQYLTGYEGRMMRSMKSLLGTSLLDGQTEVAGRALPFRMLLAQFIGELKRRAEASAGRAFEYAVLGRPVHFIDEDKVADQRAEDALRDIALNAGLREVSFQFEPIAAAFQYEQDMSREELVLVVDIGGGTSDFSLLRLGPQRVGKAERQDDILGSAGVHIGGTDFDKYLSLSSFMPLLGLGSQLKRGSEMPSSHYFNLATWHTINLAYTPKAEREVRELVREAAQPELLQSLLELILDRAGHWLAFSAEQAKIALSSEEEVELALARLSPARHLLIQRPSFDQAVAGLTTRIGEAVSGLLQSAGVEADRIDTVFFTGGASAVPSMRAHIAGLLPAARKVEGDLFGSIGSGLALEAHRKYG